MSKKCQARVVEACVESSLLYDCHSRVWYMRDMKRLQSWMDKCYRYVWSNRNGAPLRQMQERGVNMWDVRKRLGVKSIRWKIEKRVLERIGHVMRMGNERLTKAMILGWYEKLEGHEKRKGRKRKTVLYWKRMLIEAGIDWTDVERISSDRKAWKERVLERMNHLYNWECQKGHEYLWGENEEHLVRNERRAIDLVCRYEGCGKVCLSKAGLTKHQKRIHRVHEERKRFECGVCGMSVETEVVRVNHERSCTGGADEVNGRRQCGRCDTWITKGNYARHVRGCRVEEREEQERPAAATAGGEERGRGGGRRGKVSQCPGCARWLSAANMARHQRSCRVWDPGGGGGNLQGGPFFSKKFCGKSIT